jgi:hypothetical protein
VPQKAKPNLIPKLAVTPSAARLLDPRMLIGRHRLGGELTSDPKSLFGEHNALSRTARSQGCRHTPDPTPDNEYRCGHHGRSALGGGQIWGRKPTATPPHRRQKRSPIHDRKADIKKTEVRARCLTRPYDSLLYLAKMRYKDYFLFCKFRCAHFCPIALGS